LLIFLLAAVLADQVAPHDPLARDLSKRLRPGIWDERGVEGYLFGTDHLGRDVLSRVIFGTRISLGAGLGSAALATVLGIAVGSLGLFSAKLDSVAMRLMDVLFAFPDMLLALTIVAVLGPGLFNVVIAIATVSTPRIARVVAGQMLQIKEQEYMLAARALGAGVWRLLYAHALPNLLPITIVYSSLTAGRAILTVAGLSFLGLGATPPTPEWGAMLSEARELILIGAWWGVLLPGLAILLVVVAFNFLGDGLRDVLDPKLT
jgi:ABC-type dipeptide/oligopeptide/nickel transport system permease subunit